MTQLSVATLHIDSTQIPHRVQIVGDWTVENYASLITTVRTTHAHLPDNVVFDLQQLAKLDTAGATLLSYLLGSKRLKQLAELMPDLPKEQCLLLTTIGQVTPNLDKPTKTQQITTPTELLERIGIAIERFYTNAKALLGFIGLTLATFTQILFKPKRWRITSLVANVELIGLDAVPIIALLTFMVGAVIAFLGATVLNNFGASIFTVNLVVFSFLREFAVLLTAILMAGRTASSFTAQIGLMKANEEIDAIRVIGLNPIELLVLPRVAALIISLPMLTFIGMICGILGGMVVCALMLNISPVMFLSVTQDSVSIRHFFVGISKAPIFAFLIAIIGCLEGFKVTGSAASVGEHTTSSVVHSIFVVILLDALAALFFMEMGW